MAELCTSNKKSTIKIGIDPDLVKSGVALVKDGKLMELHALGFPQLLEFAQAFKEEALFIIENVEYDKTTYKRPNTTPAMMRKIAQNVGMVKGTARHLISCLEYMGCKVVKVKPLTGMVKRKAKKDGEFFNKTFGWKGRTNEDKRDAALLALLAA